MRSVWTLDELPWLTTVSSICDVAVVTETHIRGDLWNLIDPPGFEEVGGEESMSDDPDLPKASYALQVLRQARFSRNETAAKLVEHLVYVTANTGLRTPEIEEAHQAAWVAISELAKALEEEEFAGPTLWKAALRATESWKAMLD
jgi:hypothetical protein